MILRYAFIIWRLIIYANICRDCKVEKQSFNIWLYEVYIWFVGWLIDKGQQY